MNRALSLEDMQNSIEQHQQFLKSVGAGIFPDRRPTYQDAGFYRFSEDATTAGKRLVLKLCITPKGLECYQQDVSFSDWSEVICVDASFEHSNLEGSLFSKAKLKNVIFKNIHFTLTDFSEAVLENVVFDNCHFYRTNFKNTQCENVTFNEVNFHQAFYLNEAYIPKQTSNHYLIEKLMAKGFYQRGKHLEGLNLTEFKEKLISIFKPYFDEAYIRENLSIPLEYVNFLKHIGGMLSNSSDYFHGPNMVISDTDFWLDLYGEDFLEDEQPKDIMKLHLSIMSQGDKNTILLDCDKTSKNLHKYFWFEDAHPWDGYSECVSGWESLEAFLKSDYRI